MKPNQLHMNTKLLFIFLRKVFCYLKSLYQECSLFVSKLTVSI